MSTDIKLSNAKISKIIQSGRSFGSWLAILANKEIKKMLLVYLPRDNLPGLEYNLASNCNKYTWKKNKWKRSCQHRKRI